ncbi:Ribonuclease H-like domain containing protein [Parasponia andersonii]|uniref:Ribonuclease H-like domain containing protein n=1 Tax=Parasponia andersonii TaxID=3476 RepID=A0A2P5DT63_PARAD|nr:Ribonuclease H-like domain containing protein [Parasponia andersonii]
MIEPCPPPTPNYQLRREKPGSGELKLNVDVACFPDGGYTRINGIIRDHSSLVRAAFSRRLVGCYDPLVAELLAIKTGLKFAKALGVLINILESDCNNAVNMIESFGGCSSPQLLLTILDHY